MNAELNQHIDRLRHMTTAQLQLQYRELFGQASHSNHKNYLFRRVAWRLQALAEGGLSERARQYALEIATEADLRLCAPNRPKTQPAVRVANASRQRDPRVPAPGTQLIKRYKKDTIAVTVLEDGYQYGERVYKSLSAIARQVGWTALERRYEDGGYTGANLERPALRALIDDIESGQVDCVVVYKVDRLSRSLLDFARLIGTFEEHRVSLVSVTQQLNTTDSLGRLTLNILLSFAHYAERGIMQSPSTEVAVGLAFR